MTSRLKKTTNTTLVLEALIRADDFLTAKMLSHITGVNERSVSTALWSLHNFHAVDCVDGNRYLWWFATPENDTRIRPIHERVPESKPRRPKRKKLADLPLPPDQVPLPGPYPPAVGSSKTPLEQIRDLEKIAKEFKNG